MPVRKILVLCLFIFLLYLSACQKRIKVEDQISLKPFPEMPYPADNPKSLKSFELGKKIFFDRILSIDKSISCASCHKPHFAFSDGLAMSPGVFNRPGKRNTPSLMNVGYHPYYLREGSVPTLEMQILVPIQEENEFNHNIVAIAQEMKKDSVYQKMSMEAYGREIDPFVISRALGNFQRSLISDNSRFDDYVFKKKKSALNESEQEGMILFFGEKAKCSSCHSGVNFTNYAIENNGLYMEYKDPGKFRLSLDSNDIAKFKVPSLRNVALTAPYMHDGSMNSLEEVVNHYSDSIHDHPNKNPVLTKLNLSKQEKENLLAFLKTLTDKRYGG